jgi:SsrA-binding protein
MNTLINKKAKFDYEFLEEYVAGLILLGSEVKAIRSGDVNFGDSFAYFKDGDIWIKSLHISKHKNSSYNNHDEMRERKVLLNKNEIVKISKYLENKGITLIPTQLFILRGKIKVKLAVCRGKKSHDKRETIKKRDIQREISRQSDF